MAKNYTDQLADWVNKRKKKKPRQEKNLVEFLAVRTDVAEARAAGYAFKTIWEHLHELGKITSRYETFLRHAKNHLPQNPAASAPLQPEPESAEPKPKQSEKSKKVEAPAITGFSFNPQPNKEDLI